MGINGTLEDAALYDRAVKIVMSENACDVDRARSSLAGSASTHRLPLNEVATAVVAVSGS